MEPGARPPSQPVVQIQLSATPSQHPGMTPGPPPPLQHHPFSHHSPQPPTMTTVSTWKVHQNYHQDLEVAVNHQVNLELYASYIYLSMSYLFDHNDGALKNFAKYFLHQPHEDRECAEKLMKLQNEQSGRIFLQNTKKPHCDDWQNELNVMECALYLGKSVNQSLLDLYKLATDKK